MKRISSSLLLCILLSVFVSCSQGSTTGTTSPLENRATTDAPTGADTRLDTANQALSDLPVEDYDGVNFNILTRAAVGSSETEIWVEEMNGDVINDAVFTRNQKVNEKYNININIIPGDVLGLAKKSLLAGDNAYDLIYPNMADAASMGADGLLYNFNDLPSVDMEAPWWDSGTKNMEIGGKVYFMNGDINYLDNDVTYILMFNKQLIKDEGLAEPYELVRQGKWTIDVFTSMIKDVTEDINGDGQFTYDDKYGFITTNAGPKTFFYASGLKIIDINSSGEPVITLDNPKTVSVLEKVIDIFHKDNTTILPPVGKAEEGGVGITCFMEDRGLFYGEVLSYISNMRSMETPFGVLPLPKYDEAQTEYVTHVDPIASTVTIPMNTPDPVKIGSILEAMAIESYIHVTPAYYNIALQRKFVRDDESAEMLDIILANRVYDMGLLYGSLGLSGVFNDLGNKGSTDFVSAYAKVSEKALKSLNTLVGKYNSIE